MGDIYLAEDKNNKRKVALKHVDKDIIEAEKEGEPDGYFLKAFNQEVEIMKKCDCQFSVRLYEAFRIEDYYIVMELCDGDLHQKLKEKVKLNGTGFTEREIYFFLTQITKVFEVMNLHKIIHRDIKLDNILVCEANIDLGFIVKLSNYGISKILQDENNFTYTGSPSGSPYSMAPEVMQRKICNEQVDIWSLGIILYKLYFNEYPYSDKELLDEADNLKFPDNITISSHFKDLLLKILKKDPNNRLTLSGITSHPFFLSNC